MKFDCHYQLNLYCYKISWSKYSEDLYRWWGGPKCWILCPKIASLLLCNQPNWNGVESIETTCSAFSYLQSSTIWSSKFNLWSMWLKNNRRHVKKWCCSYHKAKLILRFSIYWMVLIQTIVTVDLSKQRRDGYNASNQVLKKKQIILQAQFLKKTQIFSSNTETREQITSCRCLSWVFYFYSTIFTFFWVDVNLNI